MVKTYTLMPNESIVLKEVRVAHGKSSLYTDELFLTNINIIYVNKGSFGNTKGIYIYPLNQIKRNNGKAQVRMEKQSNGIETMKIDFLTGTESFRFDPGNKKKINKWIDAITQVIDLGAREYVPSQPEEDDYDPDTLYGAFKEVADEFNDVKQEFIDAIGWKPKKKKSGNTADEPVKITKKCISCSAPLTGYKGQTVKCKYCDTVQTL